MDRDLVNNLPRMRVFPQTGPEWSALVLAPFKTYPIAVFIIATVWSSETRGEPMIVFILLGYLLCVVGIGAAAALDTWAVQSATMNWHWFATVSFIALLFALKWLPTLAE